MDIDYLTQTGKTAIEEFQYIVDVVKKEVADERHPLEKRWELFLIFCKYFPCKSFYIDFKSLGNNLSWYDDFNLEKYEVMKLDELIEQAEERKTWVKSLADINIDELKNEVMKSGYGSFENNW